MSLRKEVKGFAFDASERFRFLAWFRFLCSSETNTNAKGSINPSTTLLTQGFAHNLTFFIIYVYLVQHVSFDQTDRGRRGVTRC